MAVFAAVQWPFANFLMSPAARNWFFGTQVFRLLRLDAIALSRATCSVPTEPGAASGSEAAWRWLTAVCHHVVRTGAGATGCGESADDEATRWPFCSRRSCLHSRTSGSPDVFFEGNAGPYRLLVTIRPPQVVPGVAEIEIRSASTDVRQIHIVPLRLGFKGDQYTPVPDLARSSREDPQYYTGGLWLMATGSWQVRVDVDGDRGPGRLSVPVPALATRVAGMKKAIGADPDTARAGACASAW